MATTADFRNGMCIYYNNEIWQILDFQHVKMQQRRPIVRTKLKNLTTSKVLEVTFSAGDKVDEVRVERRKVQFLYKDDSGYTFMDQDTYDQFTLNESMVPSSDLLKEGQEVEILFQAETEQPLLVELPPFVILEVAYTEPGVRGDTATNVTKPARLETGAEVAVPLFVDTGEKIKVDTRSRSYVERVK
ncbi:MAG: elongation factor P [Chitinophagales bacterium]|nr:MAG: elongation factor P [Chitinophagales bacterium]